MDNLKELAMLKDGFAYQKDTADLYAKVLKKIWDMCDNEIDGKNAKDFDLAKEIIKIIPERAL